MNEAILTEEFLKQYKTKKPNFGFNGMGEIVYKRTYSRIIPEEKRNEEWWETVQRCIEGAQAIGADYTKKEAERLYDHVFNLRCNFAGRMLWQLGTETVKRFGFASLLNCHYVSMTEPEDFCFIFENLMLGGGVGFSVRREDIHELPRIKRGVDITHKNTKDADFIVPDSREGWVSLLRKTLESYFITGKSFTYSTLLVRGAGEPIKGFGGTASGPHILVDGITKISNILKEREGKKLTSLDVLDINNILGSVVVAGNVRRSAEISIGDYDDVAYIKAKRWDLGNIPNWRAMSNNTVHIDKYEDILPQLWEGYKGNGEPYGLFNGDNTKKYGRLKDGIMRNSDLYPKSYDNAVGTNPCFTGDTIVAVADGRNGVTIKQLAEESKGKNKFLVYSGKQSYFGNQFGTSNKFNKWTTEIKEAVAFKTGIKKVIEVRLSDGSTFKCTPEHLLATSDGKWIEAQNSVGEKMSKFYSFSNKNTKKSYRHINSKSNGYAKQYRMLYEFINGEYDGTRFEINHIDGNSTNDNLENLQLITVDEHRQITDRSGINNPRNKIIDKDRYSVIASLGTTKRNYKVAGKSDNEIEELTKELRESIPEKIDNNIYLDEDIYVVAIRDAGIEEVYDLNVPDNHSFYIITNSDDENYMNSSGILVHNCAEISLADGESCNLCELYLNRIENKEQLIDCAKLLYKTQKAVWTLPALYEKSEKITKKNMRIGLGVTGICQSLDKIDWLDDCYVELRKFDKEWSKKKGYPESIKLTTVKPSGTLSLLAGATPGVHPAYAKYYIRRIRMSSGDSLVESCRNKGYHVEYVKNFDGSENRDTVIIEFPCHAGDNAILAKDLTAVEQLELVKKLQTVWADNAVSVTVYYKLEELDEIKEWMKENYTKSIKTVSFLLHSEHGFAQAPYEEITKEEYDKKLSAIKKDNVLQISVGNVIDGLECEGGTCPVR